MIEAAIAVLGAAGIYFSLRIWDRQRRAQRRIEALEKAVADLRASQPIPSAGSLGSKAE